MPNRIALLVVALGLAMVLGGTQMADAGANDPAWVTAANTAPTAAWPSALPGNAGFTGLPDLDRGSAKFLVMNGEQQATNQSLEGVSAGRHIVRLQFPSTATNVRIALFDANTTGFWDQVADGVLLNFAPRVSYQVFVDPDGMTGAMLRDAPDLENLGATLLGRRIVNINSDDASLAGSDNKWCSLYDQAIASATHMGGLDTRGNINLVFYARVVPNRIPSGVGNDVPGSPGTFLQGTERVGYKLAFNGKYLLPGGTLLGFGGGAIDERYPIPAGSNSSTVLLASTNDPMLGQTIPGTSFVNSYDGVFNFDWDWSHACAGDITFYEADADWNDPNPPAALGLSSSGVPADNGGIHNITIPAGNDAAGNPLRPPVYFPPLFPLHDNSIWSVGTPVRWFIHPAGAGDPVSNPAFALPFYSSDASANPNRQAMPAGWLDHASVNVIVQNVAPYNGSNGVGDDRIFQVAPLSQAVITANPGLWRVRWDGVDASNFVFMKFNTDVGTIPRESSISGTLFCDDNTNGVQDTGEMVIDGGTPAGMNWNVSIQALTGPLPGGTPVGAPILTPVNNLGQYGPVPVPAGDYAVTAVPVGVQPETAPGPIGTTALAQGNTWSATVDIPMTCVQPAPICGWVYCEESVPSDCLYTAGVDRPLPGNPIITLTITPTNPAGASFEVMTDAMGQYTTANLAPGVYTVAVKAGQVGLALAPGCLATQQVTVAGQKVGPIDFGYVCPPQQCCGDLFCDDNMNGTQDPGEPIISPLLGWTVDVTSTTLPQPITMTVPVNAQGRWCINLAPDTYTFTVKYQGSANTATWPANLVLSSPNPQTKTVPVPPINTPTPPPLPDVDTGFKCVVDICGTLYCSSICPVGAYMPGSPTDRPLPGVTVQLVGPTGPMSSTQTTTTGTDGSYCFTGLLPGTYTITPTTTPIVPPPVIITAGPTPASRTVIIPQINRATVNNQNFGYCCEIPRGDICFRVFCDDDCDGLYDTGEPGYAGVTVTLTNAQGVVVGSMVSVVSPTGGVVEQCFTMLPPGNYTISIAGNSFPVNVLPGGSQTVPLVLIGGGKTNTDFPICKLGDICGRVWLDEGELKCDGVYQPGVDQPLGGFTVKLTDASGAMQTTLTGPDGTYCFTGLVPGTYTVSLPAPFNTTRTITLAANQTVQVPVVALQTTTVNFNFCKQQICGKVWCEPSEEDCDGIYQSGIDTPIAGIEVLLTGTGGEALGVSRTTTTALDGTYCFMEIPRGTYNVRISDNPNNLPLIVGKVPQGTLVYTLEIKLGDCPDKVDFYYCPCDQEICVKVFKERGEDCDGEFDADVDWCLEWIEVFVTEKGNDQGYIANGWTNEKGEFCFKGLPPGEYWVYVGANQQRLYGLKPCDANPKHPCPLATVVLKPCEDEKVSFCFCEPCPEKPCCEGKLREVVVDAKVWVGECDDCFAVSAHLLEDCDSERSVLGEVWGDYCGHFPGAIKGLDGVLTIENVHVLDGVAVVRVRIKAVGPEFPGGFFSNLEHNLAVFVNGKHVNACMKLRCETMRPGAVFPWSRKCGEQPECVEKDGYVWDKYWDWFWCNGCPADFIVVHRTTYEAWRACNPCTPERKWKMVTINYECDDCVEDHRYMVKLKNGREVMDQLVVEFWGNEWTGPKDAENGNLTLVKVWRTDHGVWKAKVKVHYECGCDSYTPSNLKLWSKIDSCSKDKRVNLECEVAEHVKD